MIGATPLVPAIRASQNASRVFPSGVTAPRPVTTTPTFFQGQAFRHKQRGVPADTPEKWIAAPARAGQPSRVIAPREGNLGRGGSVAVPSAGMGVFAPPPCASGILSTRLATPGALPCRKHSTMVFDLQLFASKKGGGSTRNGRDSNAQRLGVKLTGAKWPSRATSSCASAAPISTRSGRRDRQGPHAVRARRGQSPLLDLAQP